MHVKSEFVGFGSNTSTTGSDYTFVARVLWFLSVVSAQVALPGCTEKIHHHSGYVTQTELRKFSNYVWLQQNDSLTKQSENKSTFNTELHKSIDRRLKAIGFINIDVKPYLIVHYHLVLKDDATIRPLDGENSNLDWLSGRVETYRDLKSTLIIDMVDAASGDIIWWGMATEVLPGDSDDLSADEIDAIVVRIFRHYPMKLKHPS